MTRVLLIYEKELPFFIQCTVWPVLNSISSSDVRFTHVSTRMQIGSEAKRVQLYNSSHRFFLNELLFLHLDMKI